METVELNLPTFWASALINGDTSGMSDEDEAALNMLTGHMLDHYGKCWCISCSEDEGDFRTYHDARQYGVLACDVLTYTFDVSGNPET